MFLWCVCLSVCLFTATRIVQCCARQQCSYWRGSWFLDIRRQWSSIRDSRLLSCGACRHKCISIVADLLLTVVLIYCIFRVLTAKLQVSLYFHCIFAAVWCWAKSVFCPVQIKFRFYLVCQNLPTLSFLVFSGSSFSSYWSEA